MANRSKVPRRIAGVKIPKPLRQGLKRLARTQNGRTVLGEALVAAAGVVAAHEAKPGSRTRTAIAESAPQARDKAGALAGEARSWVDSAGAFEDAARAFVDTLKSHSADAAPATTTTTPTPTPTL